MKRSWLPKPIAVAVALSIVLISAAAIAGGTQSKDQDPLKQLPKESKQEYKARLLKEGKIRKLSGPETAGTEIEVGGRKVKLPTDAFVAEYVIGIDCAVAPCPEVPAYILKRGNSQVWVSVETAKTYRAQIAVGEESVFDFLKEVTHP